jgi:hypothetical protein
MGINITFLWHIIVIRDAVQFTASRYISRACVQSVTLYFTCMRSERHAIFHVHAFRASRYISRACVQSITLHFTCMRSEHHATFHVHAFTPSRYILYFTCAHDVACEVWNNSRAGYTTRTHILSHMNNVRDIIIKMQRQIIARVRATLTHTHTHTHAYTCMRRCIRVCFAYSSGTCVCVCV